jgi:hypothetical protein
MIRVVRKQGAIIWYDMRVNNPRNNNSLKVSKRQVFDLFRDCKIELRATTLAPPIARLLAPRSWLLAELLEKIPLLCTHYFGIIRKA